MAVHFLLIICCFFWTTSIKSTNSTSRKELYIGAFFGVNITDGWSTAGVISAFEMALHHVNNNPNILTDYELKYVWRDSKVTTQLLSK